MNTRFGGFAASLIDFNRDKLWSRLSVLQKLMSFAGIRVAICDTRDCCVFELRKPFLFGEIEGEGAFVDFKALIEALDDAVALGYNDFICFAYMHFKKYGESDDI